MTAAGPIDLAERAPIYAWLARLLVCEVDATTWAELGPARDLLIQLQPELTEQLATALSANRCEALAEEFARLFLLPNGVSPFASSWVAGAKAGESARDEIATLVERGLAAIGYEAVYREPWGRLPRDHVAVILDLVAAAQRATDAGNADIAGDIADRLDQELLGGWVIDFGQALAQSSREPFYRAVGQFLVELHRVT